jgi:hypothetical protein
MLINSGKPSLDQDDSDDDIPKALNNFEEDDAFGIVPTRNLKKQEKVEEKKQEKVEEFSGFMDMSDPTAVVEPEVVEKKSEKKKQPAFLDDMVSFGFNNGNTVVE